MCRSPRAISSRRFIPPENVFTQRVAPVPQLEQLQQRLDALGARPARHVVEHAVQVHVLVGGQLAVEARVLEDDAEPLADFVRLRRRVEAVDARSCRSSARSSVVSIWMVVVLPAPLGPRNAKISPARDVERDAVDGGDLAELLDQVLDMNHRCVEPPERGILNGLV